MHLMLDATIYFPHTHINKSGLYFHQMPSIYELHNSKQLEFSTPINQMKEIVLNIDFNLHPEETADCNGTGS